MMRPPTHNTLTVVYCYYTSHTMLNVLTQALSAGSLPRSFIYLIRPPPPPSPSHLLLNHLAEFKMARKWHCFHPSNLALKCPARGGCEGLCPEGCFTTQSGKGSGWGACFRMATISQGYIVCIPRGHLLLYPFMYPEAGSVYRYIYRPHTPGMTSQLDP